MVKMMILKGGNVSAQMRKGFREGMSSAIQSLSAKAAIKPADLRLAMEEVLERVGGDGNPNSAAAEIDASIKRGLAKAVVGRVDKQDKADVKKFLAIGLQKTAKEESRTKRPSKKASTVKSTAHIQKPTLQKRVGSVARAFRTVGV